MSSNTVINSAEFTDEQKEYLRGFFAGVSQRGLIPFVGHTADGRITNDPASGLPNRSRSNPSHSGSTLPSPISPRKSVGSSSRIPSPFGTSFFSTPIRTNLPPRTTASASSTSASSTSPPRRTPSCFAFAFPAAFSRLISFAGLRRWPKTGAPGRVDLTTRSNLQIREFQPKDIVRVLNRVQSLGMTSRGSGADNIRNITASPITGLDPQELLDVAPLAEALQSYISNSRDMYDLPRKFNVAFDNGGAISVVADTNDIGFVAVEVGEGRSIPAGIYFRVLLCGITGHRQFATDCGLLLRPDQTVAVAAAMIRVFTQHGDRTDRKKARLKYLIDPGASRSSSEKPKSFLPSLSFASLLPSANHAAPSTVPDTSESTRNRNPASTTSASPSQ